MKEFTENWFSPNNFRFFKQLPGPKKYLEVGSFEGKSLCWMMDNILTGEDDVAYAIDTFSGGDEHQGLNMGEVEQRFLRNTSEYGTKLKVCKGESFDQLISLIPDHRETFDYVFVDGSHNSWDVISDAVLAFKLLKKGGVMGFDDYIWNWPEWGQKCPRSAIEAFLYTHQDFVRVLSYDYQLWLQKL